MCRRWFVLVFVFSLLGSMGVARSETIAHWQFNGTAGQEIVTDTDIESGYIAYKFYDAKYGQNAATDVFYSLPNLNYNTGGTSADFLNDPSDNDPGVGFVVPDTGAGRPLDLSTVGAFTIEAFIYPYSFRQSVIARKYGGSPGQYFIDLRVDGDVRFSINSDGNAATAGAGAVTTDEWYHVAAIFDETDLAAPMKIYINGELKGTAAFIDRPGDSPRGLGIGCIVRDNLNPPGSSGQFFHGRIDEVRLSGAALSVDDFLVNTVEGIRRPSPADGATDVPRDVVLSWRAGREAAEHDVYFSTVFDNVNDADRTNPLGVLVSQNQVPNTHEPPGLLDFDQTYYWRIDEVNGPPDHTISKGEVWSFTAEPFAYPIENVTPTASSSDVGKGPENTVNGSGLDDSGLLHGKEADSMWLSDIAGPQPSWIEFQFDKVYKLQQMWVWNSNEFFEPLLGVGFKDVAIEYSVNGTDYTTLGTTHEFAQAPGTSDYAYNTTVDFSGLTAKYVRLTANSNWGGMLNQYGLSEVRFLYIPVRAREPYPRSGATDVYPDVVLSWRAGREAAEHDVYFSTDEQAVIDDTISPVSVPAGRSYASYDTGTLDLGQIYYWKVSEVNEAQTPTTWQGDVSNFSTREYLVVEDFEAYNDLDPSDPESSRIFLTWLDGYDQPTNGSIVGYDNPPFAEQSIVHSGEQAMPFFYNNTSGAAYSEAERTLAVPQNWTEAGIQSLVLYFHGTSGNTGQLYVKINDSKVVYDGDVADIQQTLWKQWNIDLASLGAGVQNVTKLVIGIDGNGATGTLYVDDIRLYRLAPQPEAP